MRIGCDDCLQLSFMRTVAAIAVRMIAADQRLVGAADGGGGGGIIQPERTERLCVTRCWPARLALGRPARPAKQIMGIAKVKGLAALFGDNRLPAGERRLGVVDLVRRQAIEEIIPGVEGADMFEAEILPPGAVPRYAVAQRRAELARLRAARSSTGPGLGLDAATMEAGSRNGARSLGSDEIIV
jgi:hypothetical protein